MMSKLMLSCRHATALMEKRHRGEITLIQKIQLYFHTALCAACRQYQQQSAWMEQLFRSRDQQAFEYELDLEATDLEAKILRQLEERE